MGQKKKNLFWYVFFLWVFFVFESQQVDMSSLDIREDAVNHAILNSEQENRNPFPPPSPNKKKERKKIGKEFFFFFKTKDDPFPGGSCKKIKNKNGF